LVNLDLLRRVLINQLTTLLNRLKGHGPTQVALNELLKQVESLDLDSILDLRKKIDRYQKLDFSGYDIELLVTSQAEKRYRVTSCKREPKTVEWISTLPPDIAIIDIGANVGAYSLIAASYNRTSKKNWRIYSFEPHYANFGNLYRNIIHNDFSEFIVPVNLALGAASGIQPFFHWDKYGLGEAGSSGHQLNRSLDYSGAEFEPVCKQWLTAMSLDQFCEVFKVTPGAIKIDVDGLESDVLKGSQLTLQSGKCKHVMVEVSTANQEFVESYFDNLGFKLQMVGENNNHFFELPR
jgi:FkbM family methyltransferase